MFSTLLLLDLVRDMLVRLPTGGSYDINLDVWARSIARLFFAFIMQHIFLLLSDIVDPLSDAEIDCS